jgi:hypothetical protein
VPIPGRLAASRGPFVTSILPLEGR